MRRLMLGRWEPIDSAFIRGDEVSGQEPMWSGHFWRPWADAIDLEVGRRVELSIHLPACQGTVIITAVTPAEKVIKNDTGVWVDFHGVGRLLIDGEPVEFVKPPPSIERCLDAVSCDDDATTRTAAVHGGDWNGNT